MRFRKGSKVEVLIKKEFLTGSWLCGEIISGNGRIYSVRYDWFPVTSEAIMERVPRKAIRPCPPPVKGAVSWVPGDHVEAFHNLSWKTATILRVLGVNDFLVRLLGVFEEFKVHRSHLRTRQCWQEGKWFVVGEGSGPRTTMTRKTSNGMKSRELGVGENCFPANVASGTLKRSSVVGLTHLEECPVPVQKARAIEISGIPQQKYPGHPLPLCKKVDAYIFTHGKLGEKYTHNPFINGTTEISEMDVDRGRRNSFPTGTFTHLDTESHASSVASCSVNGNLFDHFPLNFRNNHNIETGSHCSDTDSFCGRGFEEEGCSSSKNEELVVHVCRPELLAYRSTITALYASGPLSWEDEARVTDLRHSLHISDDEHLMELRDVIANTTNSVC